MIRVTRAGPRSAGEASAPRRTAVERIRMRSPRCAASLPCDAPPRHDRCRWPGARFLGTCGLVLFLLIIPGLHGVALGLDPVLRGVNDAGGEFIPLPLPEGHPLAFSSSRTLEYVAGKGLKLVRLPFAWEQMQPVPGRPLDAQAVAALRAYLEEADRRGLQVIPDLHNYARFTRVGSDGRAAGRKPPRRRSRPSERRGIAAGSWFREATGRRPTSG